MRSFEYGYYLETPLSHALLMTMRSLGEFRGRQTLYTDQFPEVLDTLRRVAIIQSTESSNRIEGITVGPGRIEAIVSKKASPRDRSEQEVAGYRDFLHPSIPTMPGLKFQTASSWTGIEPYTVSPMKWVENGKKRTMLFLKLDRMGVKWCAFSPCPRWPHRIL